MDEAWCVPVCGTSGQAGWGRGGRGFAHFLRQTFLSVSFSLSTTTHAFASPSCPHTPPLTLFPHTPSLSHTTHTHALQPLPSITAHILLNGFHFCMHALHVGRAIFILTILSLLSPSILFLLLCFLASPHGTSLGVCLLLFPHPPKLSPQT